MRLALVSLLCVLAAMAAAPAAAPAALPKPEKTYSVHDHQTPGDNWHVEMKINKTGRQIVGLVLHAERCGKHTPFGTGIIVAEDGSVSANGPLDEGDPAAGSWSLVGRFTETHRFDGEFRFVTPDCDTGPMLFVAHSGKHAHKHTALGLPFGAMPDFSSATAKAQRQAERLWRASLASAQARFPTYLDAIHAGFRRYNRNWKKPVLFHVRSKRYDRDRVSFDARRPESLVYWWAPDRDPVLVAFMYRRPLADRAPAFGRGLLGWHAHGTSSRASLMTHVWLTADRRSGLANCLPVDQVEDYVDAFEFQFPATGLGHESMPCPAGA